MTATSGPRGWTQAKDDVIRELYGVASQSEIGRMIGASQRTVSRRVEQLGLEPKVAPRGLDGRPLAAAVRRWIVRSGQQRDKVISDEQLKEWEAGGRVLGPAADRWVCRMGVLWFDVWDLDDRAAHAYFVGPDVDLEEAA